MGGRDDAQLAEQPVVRVRRVPNPGLDPGPLRGALAKPPAACEWHPHEWCRDAIRADERERDRRIHVREVRNAGSRDAGQPHDMSGDLGGRRPGARKDVEVRERLRDLGALPRLALERGLGGALTRHVPLDGDEARYRTALVEDRREDGLLMEQAPVLAPVRHGAHERLPAREGCPQRLVERRSLDPALEDARVLAHDLVAGVAADLLEGRVHVLDRAGRVGDDDRVGGLLDGRRQPAHLELRAMAGARVADRHDDAVPELRTSQVQALVERPAGRVGINEWDVVRREWGAGFDDAHPDVEEPVRPVGREHLEQAATDLQRSRKPAERADHRVRVVDDEVDDPAVPIADGAIDRDAVEHRVQRGPQALLRGLEGRGELLAFAVDALALRDVVPDREQAVAEVRDLDVHAAEEGLAIGARDRVLHAVLGPALTGLDDLAEDIEEVHPPQVGHLVRHQRADDRVLGATHEGGSRAIGEDDPEVDDRPRRVPLSRADQERVRHRVERAAHGGLRCIELGPEPDPLARRGALGERAPHGRDERLQPALEDVVGGAAVEGLDNQVLAGGARDQDHRDTGVPGMGRRHGSPARKAGQLPVREDDLGGKGGQCGEELGLGGHHPGVDVEAPLAQGAGHELGVVRRVLDEQDPQRRRLGFGHPGTSFMSTQYRPSSLTARMNCSKSTGLTM